MQMSSMPPPLPPTANTAGLSQGLCPGTSPDLRGYVELRKSLGEIPQSTHYAVLGLSAILVAGAFGYYTSQTKLKKKIRSIR